MESLKFDSRLIKDVTDGSKTATVRYGVEQDIELGTLIEATDENGEAFATLRVTGVAEVPLHVALDAVDALLGGHGAESPEDLKESLNTYYDEDITWETKVKVIRFELAEQIIS